MNNKPHPDETFFISENFKQIIYTCCKEYGIEYAEFYTAIKRVEGGCDEAHRIIKKAYEEYGKQFAVKLNKREHDSIEQNELTEPLDQMSDIEETFNRR